MTGSGCRPPGAPSFRTTTLDALARILDEPRHGHAFVVVESLFSMDGDVAPLADYASLCRSPGASLIVDEAHAVGVYGARGSGLIEALGRRRRRARVGEHRGQGARRQRRLRGGAVVGDRVPGAARAAVHLLDRASAAGRRRARGQPVDRRRRTGTARVPGSGCARHLRERLTAEGVPVPPGDSQIIPVVLGENDRALAVAQAMQAHGFDVRAIRPPTVPAGTARLRIAVNIGLDEPTLDRFAVALGVAGAVDSTLNAEVN